MPRIEIYKHLFTLTELGYCKRCEAAYSNILRKSVFYCIINSKMYPVLNIIGVQFISTKKCPKTLPESTQNFIYNEIVISSKFISNQIPAANIRAICLSYKTEYTNQFYLYFTYIKVEIVTY